MRSGDQQIAYTVPPLLLKPAFEAIVDAIELAAPGVSCLSCDDTGCRDGRRCLCAVGRQ
jgi:hypothetical protein